MNEWWKRFRRWVERLLGIQQQRPGARVVKTWTTRLGTLHRLERNVTGAVATYRFIPAYQQRYDLLLTCDQLRRSVSASSRKRRAISERDLDPSWKLALAAPSHPTPSHIFAVVKVARLPDSRTKSIEVRVERAYFVDFIGVRVYAPPDYHARLISADIAQELLMRHADEIVWEEVIHEKAELHAQSNHQSLYRSRSKS